MSSLAFTDIAAQDFRTSTTVVDGELRVVLVGNADMQVRAELQQLLAQLDVEALRLGVKTVVVDFRELEFINSSCFKGFVTWINTAKGHEPGVGYGIRFASSDRRAWHRRSLYALQCFATDLVTIEVL